LERTVLTLRKEIGASGFLMFVSLFAANHETIVLNGYVDIFAFNARKFDIDLIIVF